MTTDDWFDIVQDSSHLSGITLLFAVMAASLACWIDGKEPDRFIFNLWAFATFWHAVSLISVLWWKHVTKDRNRRWGL